VTLSFFMEKSYGGSLCEAARLTDLGEASQFATLRIPLTTGF